jgi:hypothetical protein
VPEADLVSLGLIAEARSPAYAASPTLRRSRSRSRIRSGALGVFSRIEHAIERHWHEPFGHHLHFHLGAPDPDAAFGRVMRLRPGGWSEVVEEQASARRGGRRTTTRTRHRSWRPG